MKKINLLLLFLFFFLFYHFFLSTKLLIAHDWPLLFPESRQFNPLTLSWDYMGQGGLGGPAFKTFWIDLYTNFIYFVSNNLNIPWWLSQRIFWVIPFIILSIFSSYKFSTLFIKNSILRSVSSIIYSFNTYILLIIAGGQFGIAFSYALAPLSLFRFIILSQELNMRNSILFGLVYGLLIATDPRIALILLIGQFFWFITFIRRTKSLKFYLLGFLISFLINSYWILPLIFFRNSSDVFSSYSSLQEVKFLSFANFSNALSFLHPNWPENIFGKVYFLDPKFLVIPVLAFSSLLLLKKTMKQPSNQTVLFFSILAIVGVFLGKGANEPFGQFYLFLFQNFPGFSLFRDSTKFFILIAISYSILIPYFLENLNKFKRLAIVVFVFYWLIILKPGWDGQLSGIFKPKEIPREYLTLNEIIKNDNSFYRTLWIPVRQKYGFFSPTHPAIDYEALKSKIEEDILQDLSIRYVVVPQDSEGEIFLRDRKYNEKLYIKTLKKIEDLKWLRKVKNFGKLVVFEVNNPKDHFWSPSATLGINYKFISSAEYKVQLQNAKKGDLLIFSEGFDRNWNAQSSPASPKLQRGEGFRVQSSEFEGRLNSFVLPKDGIYELKISYEPQKYVETGLWLSGAVLLSSILMLSFGKRFKKW